ncbi:MAG: preprotein translocase subunit SecE, partial [Planctomycetota bacterium]
VIWLCYYKKNTVDFMIATETEMKKVNWSTRAEVLGSARVVIFISFLLAAILFGVDIVFKVIFEQIGLLHS